MVAARMAKTQIPTEEAELLTNEYKKIRGKKGRFRVKKITADSFKKGSAVGINLGKQNVLIGKSQLALPPAPDKMTGGEDIKEIIDALAEIIKSLTSQNKLAKDSAEKSRIAGEAGQRGEKESRLEKGFKFAIKAAEKIIAPIKSLLDRIIDFFVAIFVGRALIKLLDWFSDSKNQDKIKAIGRFLGEQWPKLLALYIMFGTGLGKFVGFLTKIVIRGGIRLAAAAAGLLAKAGVGKAAGASKFLGKYGKALGVGLEVAATVGTTMAVSKGIENFGGIGEEEQKTQGYSGGGFVIPKFAGGGLNFKGMMGGAGMGAMFGPLGMLLGAGLGSGKIQESVSGLIGGQKGVDKVPAMLTDGEFVMSRGAVQKYGVDTLESMNAAGGGTNQPKIVSGTTYAAGGGMIGDQKENVRDRILEKREREQKSSKPQHFGSKGLLSPDVTKSLEKPKSESESKPSGVFGIVSLMTRALSAMNPASLSLLANALGGSPAQAQTNAPPSKPNPMGDGGFLDTLGGFLPGTGNVMAPRSSGPRDIRGNQQTDPGFQFKFLGIPLGSPTSGASSRFGMTAPLGPGGDVGGYTKEQKKRYASRTGSSFVPTSYAGSISGAMGDSHLRFPGFPSLQNKKIEIPDYMMPSTHSKSQKPQSDSRSENAKINPPSKSKVKVVYATSPGGMPKLNTSSGASPSVPSFSAVHPNSESRRRSAAVLGVK
ncbi:MAG: hypothetical protein EB120_03055 [Proteobacteria bacterium]|nr:hypothetical protein [Pseudomonadota bacterium]